MLPIATWIHVLGTYVRVILIFLSYAKPKVCKVYFHYEMFMTLIDLCIVVNGSGDAVQLLSLLKITNIFYNFYYDFIQSIASVVIMQICFTTVHSQLYNLGTGEAVLNFFSMLMLLVLSLLITHVIYTSAGNMFVDAELMRDVLLNQFDDGLIIIEHETNSIIFQNQAAKDL